MRDKKTISLLLCFSLILGMCFSPGNARISRADEERIDLDSELTRIEVTPDTFVYDGTEKYPEVTVYYDGTKLTYDEDYTYRFYDNVEPGQAIVSVDGTGKYFGRASAFFTITAGEEPSTSPTPEVSESPEPSTSPTPTPEYFKKSISRDKKVHLNRTSVTLFLTKKRSYSLDKKKKYLYFKGKSYLHVLNTKKKVKYKSSSSAVATVSKKGVVKAKKPGKCKITAKVGSKKYTCKVTVKRGYSKASVKKNVTVKYKVSGNVITVKIKNKYKHSMAVQYKLSIKGSSTITKGNSVFIPGKTTITEYYTFENTGQTISFSQKDISYNNSGGITPVNGCYSSKYRGEIYTLSTADIVGVSHNKFGVKPTNIWVKTGSYGSCVWYDISMHNKLGFDAAYHNDNTYILFYKNKKLVYAQKVSEISILTMITHFGVKQSRWARGKDYIVKNYMNSAVRHAIWDGQYDSYKVFYNKNVVDLKMSKY